MDSRQRIIGYTKVIGVYLLLLFIGVAFFTLILRFTGDRDQSKIVHRVFWVLTFGFVTVKTLGFKQVIYPLFKIKRLHVLLSIILALLFIVNNYFMVHYSVNRDYISQAPLYIILSGLFLNSTFEELAYRGYIQSSINKLYPDDNVGLISPGNVTASILMGATHWGFFGVMDLTFAITSFVLVLIFSVLMGIMRDKGASFLYLIMIHILVNTIHLMMHGII